MRSERLGSRAGTRAYRRKHWRALVNSPRHTAGLHRCAGATGAGKSAAMIGWITTYRRGNLSSTYSPASRTATRGRQSPGSLQCHSRAACPTPTDGGGATWRPARDAAAWAVVAGRPRAGGGDPRPSPCAEPASSLHTDAVRRRPRTGLFGRLRLRGVGGHALHACRTRRSRETGRLCVAIPRPSRRHPSSARRPRGTAMTGGAAYRAASGMPRCRHSRRRAAKGLGASGRPECRCGFAQARIAHLPSLRTTACNCWVS